MGSIRTTLIAALLWGLTFLCMLAVFALAALGCCK